MDETQITKVAEVLSEWNPLGNEARDIHDLDGYRTEAIDIIATFHLAFIGASYIAQQGLLRPVVVVIARHHSCGRHMT